jgi:hypothetical protein
MAYLDLSDFRSGLDARKYLLALPAGTLINLTNAHINQGGEIEKRQAFIPNSIPPGTFWAQENSTGITVIGSRAISWSNVALTRTGGFVSAVITIDPSGYGILTGASVTISAVDASFNGTVVNATGGGNILLGPQAGANASTIGTITLALPAPVQYLRLLHPDGVTQMTGVITSCQFGAGIFTEALFADGNRFYYFNDTIISDFYSGLIWSGASNGFTLATNLSNLVNASGQYTATTPTLPGTLSFSIAGGSTGTAAVAAKGVFSLNNQPPNNSTVTLGSITYTFVSNLAGGPAYSVLRDANGAASLTNLYNAINAGSGFGTKYNTSTANALAQATNLITVGNTKGSFLATAITAGTSGNSIAVATTVTGAAWTDTNFVSQSTLTGGLAAIAGAGDVTGVAYNFPTIVQFTPNFSSNSAQIVTGSIGLEANASGWLSLGVLPTDGQTVTIGAKTYTFKNVLTNATPNQVLIDPGSDINQTLLCLADAVVAYGPTSGISYSSATTINLQATSPDAPVTDQQMQFTAIAAGVTAVASTTNVTGATWSCGATLRYNATLSDVAASVVVAINNATDYYGGGLGTNLGFTATSSGATVTINPPISQGSVDYLTVSVANNLTVNIPVVPFTFKINSLPNLTDGTPYLATEVDTSALGNVALNLDNIGFSKVPPVNASTSFSIVAGLSNTAATQTLTSNQTNPNVGEIITIGPTQYKFVLAFSGAANEVLIQPTADQTMSALIAAINNQSGSGVTYSLGTPKDPTVVAGVLTSHHFTVTAIVGGNVGNSVATYSTAASTTWGAATLTGGDAADTNQITQIAIGATNLLAAHVQYNQSNTQTAIDVAAAINAQSSTTGFTATAANNVITITAVAAGTALNGTAVTVTNAGQVCIDQCFFSVGSATGLATSQNISQIAVGVNLMTSTITWNGTDSVAVFCGKVVANIVANSGVSGWTAVSVGNVIYISKNTVASTDALPTVTVSATATLTNGPTTATAIALTAPSTTLAIVLNHFNSRGFDQYYGATQVVTTTTGGLGPYVYNWVKTSGSPLVKVNNAKVTNPIFSVFVGGIPGTVTAPTTGSAVWVCTVTDSVGSTATFTVTISF